MWCDGGRPWGCLLCVPSPPQRREGASEQQKEALGLMTPDYYYYLNQSGTYKVDGTNDSKDFQETMVLMHNGSLSLSLSLSLSFSRSLHRSPYIQSRSPAAL